MRNVWGTPVWHVALCPCQLKQAVHILGLAVYLCGCSVFVFCTTGISVCGLDILQRVLLQELAALLSQFQAVQQALSTERWQPLCLRQQRPDAVLELLCSSKVSWWYSWRLA